MPTAEGTWSPEFKKPFGIYIADIVQASTAAPTPTEAVNLIGDIVWARTGAGVVTATLAGAFPVGTHILAGAEASTISWERTSANVITFTNTVDGVATDGFTATVHIIVKA